MKQYDEFCDVAVAKYGLVTAKTFGTLGIYLKGVWNGSGAGVWKSMGGHYFEQETAGYNCGDIRNSGRQMSVK